MQTATNPQTGERVQWNGSAWVPLAGDAPAAPAAGPITLGTPRPQKPNVRQVGDTLGIVGDDGSFTPTYTAPEKPKAAASTNANDVKLQQKRASLDSLITQINRVEELYRQNIADEPMGPLSAVGDFLPTSENRQFDAASAGLAEQGLSAFRVPGVGAQSDTELRQFVQANRPEASDYDTTIEEKLRQLRTRVDATRQEMGLEPAQWLGQEAPAQDAGPVVHDANLGGEQLQASQNGTKTIDNPALAGVRGEYLRRLSDGQGAGELIAFLRQAGVTDPKLLRTAAQQAQFRKQNPNVPIEKYNTDALDDMDVPLSSTEGAMNDLAQSPVGAYAMNAGNAVTANTLDNIVGMTGGNSERARLALDDANHNNPVASLAGNLTGGTLAALMGEGALARAGMASSLGRGLLADTGYGAAAGAGASDGGNRLAGAGYGSLAGLVGSGVGQTVTKGAGAVIGGVTDPAVGYVAREGIPMTAGQAVGNSGRVGQAVKSIEDRLSGIPVVGDAINTRRAEGVRAMNTKAFDKALDPIGETVGGKVGEEAVAEAQDLVGQAFTRALQGKVAGLDRQFISEAGAAKNAIRSIPRIAGEVEDSIDDVVRSYFDPAGNITGENMQALLRELGQIKRGYKSDPLGHRVGVAVGKVEDAVENLFRRQSPDVIPAYDAAKKAFRRLSILEDAVLKGKNTDGVFTPAQLGQADRTNAKKFSGQHSAAAGQGEFHDYQRAMQNVLPNQVPDSGTAGRLIVPGALIAGGGAVGAASGDTQGGATTGLTLAALLSLAYSRRGQGMLAGAAVKRGPKAKAVGSAVKNRARIAGAAVGSQAALNSGD